MYAQRASQVISYSRGVYKMNDKDLQILVEEISLKLFHKPFRHEATFNSRLRTTGGRYLLRTSNIEVNYKYFEQYGRQEIVEIIKHELCHYHLHIEGKGYKHGDQDFKRLMKEVDAPRFCQALKKESDGKKKEHIYVCMQCEQKYVRKRKVNTVKYVCGKCKGKLKKM